MDTDYISMELKFIEIDKLIHNIEMQLKDENIQTDCRNKLGPLFSDALSMVIVHQNYTQSNLLKILKYEEQLEYILYHDIGKCFEDDGSGELSINKRMYIVNISTEISTLLENVLIPFRQRHNIIDQDAKPLFFDEKKHIELHKLNSTDAVLPAHDKIKLQWVGQKNQLYSVLRQLKNDHELITNSYNSLADFLIQNITGFENTSKETIEKELKKKSLLPKPKRINIDPDKED